MNAVDTPPDPLAVTTLLWIVLGVVLPVLAVCATAFAKISVVLGALRGGLGNPDMLPLPVMSGLAAVLALVVMLPVGRQALEAAGEVRPDAVGAAQAVERAWPVWDGWLSQHTKPEDEATVRATRPALAPAVPPSPSDDLTPAERVLAFMLTELTAAFQMAVAVLLPFLIVDLLVSNTLTVLGFAMLSPQVVALPFKLLLFVAVGGWGLLVRGLAHG